MVQQNGESEIKWIVETKGRVWEGTEAKDEAIQDWCARISEQNGEQWQYARVNQVDFDLRKPKTLKSAVEQSAVAQKALV